MSLHPLPIDPPAKCRDGKDFAVEFGRYLADSAEQFLNFLNKSGAAAHAKDQDGMTDHWRSLQSAIYEFRKWAAKVES